MDATQLIKYAEEEIDLCGRPAAITSQKLIDELKQLTAQVGRLREEFPLLGEVDQQFCAEWAIGEDRKRLHSILDETRLSSLNHIKAEAIEEAVSAFKPTFKGYPIVHEGELLKYAKQLREKG